MNRNYVRPRFIAIASLAVISFVIGGSGFVAVGLFIDPIMADLHWSNGLTSSAASAFTLAMVIGGPVVGVCLDKLWAKGR